MSISPPSYNAIHLQGSRSGQPWQQAGFPAAAQGQPLTPFKQFKKTVFNTDSNKLSAITAGFMIFGPVFLHNTPLLKFSKILDAALKSTLIWGFGYYQNGLWDKAFKKSGFKIR